MVEYIDGSVLAQLGTPDMRTPIAFALGWPERIGAPTPRLDFSEVRELTFEPPDLDRFPALRLAREVLRAGGGAPTVLNAANEVAVHGFLEGKLGFLGINQVVEQTLEIVGKVAISSLSDVREADRQAREVCAGLVSAAPRPA
jgi:1-deoxy-D-xylulose-5-phosphate reductoisomerase